MTVSALAAVDALLACPFPAATSQDGTSGPGHLVETLRESQDFWDDPFHEAADAAYAEFESELAVLAAALTERWGQPVTIDLWSYLRIGCEGGYVPEPIDYLCQYATSMQAWTPPGSPRWVGLALGQGDKELPIELFATVGSGPLPPAVPAPTAPDS